jgi:hypothetical protein
MQDERMEPNSKAEADLEYYNALRKERMYALGLQQRISMMEHALDKLLGEAGLNKLRPVFKRAHNEHRLFLDELQAAMVEALATVPSAYEQSKALVDDKFRSAWAYMNNHLLSELACGEPEGKEAMTTIDGVMEKLLAEPPQSASSSAKETST